MHSLYLEANPLRQSYREYLSSLGYTKQSLYQAVKKTYGLCNLSMSAKRLHDAIARGSRESDVLRQAFDIIISKSRIHIYKDEPGPTTRGMLDTLFLSNHQDIVDFRSRHHVARVDAKNAYLVPHLFVHKAVTMIFSTGVAKNVVLPRDEADEYIATCAKVVL